MVWLPGSRFAEEGWFGDSRMQPISMCCDSSSSWVCIGLYKPRMRGRCSVEELAARILSVSLSFNSTAGVSVKTAILKSRTSNHVAVFSIWEKGSILDEPYKHPKVLPRKLLDNIRATVLRRQSRSAYSLIPPLLHAAEFLNALSGVARLVDLSWYEVSCWDCRDKTLFSQSSVPIGIYASKAQPVSSLMAPLSSTLSPTLSGPLSCWDSTKRRPSPLVSTLSMPSLGQDGDEKLSLSSRQSSSPTSSSSTSPSRPSSLHVSVGDVVHLRRIISDKSYLEDVLSYSCLAILKAYFPHTDGLHSYAFYRSLDGSRMAAMGVWQSLDAATNFLHAPDGAREERFWSSLGAKTRLGIYEVVALVN